MTVRTTTISRLTRLLTATGALALGLLASHPSPANAADGAAPGVRGAISASESQAVRDRAAALINNIRARLDACGDQGMLAVSANAGKPKAIPTRPSLTWNNHLAEAARRHAESMASEAYFDHVDTKGRTVGTRVTRVGYRWRVVGENLAAGHTNIDEAVRGWLLSTGHCEVMIDERFTEFGLARVEAGSASDPYGSYWTLVVARPKQGPTLENPPAMAMR